MSTNFDILHKTYNLKTDIHLMQHVQYVPHIAAMCLSRYKQVHLNLRAHTGLLNFSNCVADASPDFQDLISQLLDKNPATRLAWKAMCEHPFWQTPLSQRPMPPEPMLDAFIKRHGLRPAAQPAAVHEDGHLEAHVRAAQVC